MQETEKRSRFDWKAAWRVLFRILRVIIPLVLLYFLFRNLDWQQILHIMAGYPYGFLLLAFGINLFANFIFALRWYYLIRSVGIRFPFWNAVRLVYYGLFISNFLPTTIGGDLIKVVGILKEKSDQSRSLRISTVVADRVFSMSSKILLLPFVLWLFPQGFKPVLDLPFLQSPFLLALIPKGISDRVIRYWAAVKPWFRFRNIAVVYLLSYSSLFFTILSYWVVIQAFQPDVPLVNVFFITLLTYFVTIMPVSINGIGIQEGSYSLLLMQIGFTYEQAFASALFIRLLTLLVSAFGGILLAVNDRQLWNEVRSEKDEELKQV